MRRAVTMRRFLVPFTFLAGFAVASAALGQATESQGEEKIVCCRPLVSDLFAGLRSLIVGPCCPEVPCPPQRCEQVVCPAPEPLCLPPVLPRVQCQVARVRQEIREVVVAPALQCPAPAVPAPKVPICPAPIVEAPKVSCCPSARRPTLLDAIRARMSQPVVQCGPCGGLLNAILKLIGCGPTICCQAHEAASEPTPAVAPSEAPPPEIKPLPKAPIPDVSA